MTDRYAVIGNPVAHSKSPWIHAEFARACGQDMEYARIEAPLHGFAEAVDRFRAAGGKGLNVTLPFKGDAFRYCPRTSERARLAQAVNTLVFHAETYGDTTDGVGLVTDLQENLQYRLKDIDVLLMGAGGAAQGVVGALLDAGVRRLVIANRTSAKAQALAARHAGEQSTSRSAVSAAAYERLAGEAFDLVINATSAGLEGGMPPLPAGVLRTGVLAYDMVYGRETAFLRAAGAAGARASDGLGMLVEQAAASFALWRGVKPQTRGVLARLRAA
jgi:shikimate dehydrogenase